MLRALLVVLLGGATPLLGQTLPGPTGPHAVGTLRLHVVDPARPELFTDDATDRREAMVRIWYPAEPEPGAPRAAYESGGAATASIAHSRVGLELARSRQRWPILFFSHGLGMAVHQYTALVEDLASHGYVIVGVDHPYLAGLVRFPDGREVVARRRSGGSAGGPIDLEAADRRREAEQLALAGDVQMVLNRLATADGPLAGRLLVDSVGMLGHSIGGTGAIYTCSVDPRFRACVNLDGEPLAPSVRAAGITQPFLRVEDAPIGGLPVPDDARLAAMGQTRQQFLAGRDSFVAEQAAVLRRMRGPTFVVKILGASHQSFSDGPILNPGQHRTSAPIDPARAIHIVSAYVRAFFDRYLQGRPAPLLAGPAAEYPEVEVQVIR